MSLLKGPPVLPETAWNAFLTENLRGGHGKLGDQVKTIAVSFKSLQEAEKERLSGIVESNKAANVVTRKKWIESYPPEAIHASNLARRRLARKTQKQRVYLIHDERMPHRGGSSFNIFIKHKLSSVSADSPRDAFRTLSDQWKLLSAAEKAPYEKEAAEKFKYLEGQMKAFREKGNKYWKEKLASASTK